MSKDIGTLQEIGAQVGDVVAYYWDSGYVTELIATDKMINEWITDSWRIISRASQGPVREVTTVRKEIVPGVYGKVDVGKIDGQSGLVFIGIMQDWQTLTGVEKGSALMSIDDLTEAINTLTAIRNAMADSIGDVSTTQAR